MQSWKEIHNNTLHFVVSPRPSCPPPKQMGGKQSQAQITVTCSTIRSDTFWVYIVFVSNIIYLTVNFYNFIFNNVCSWQLVCKIPRNLTVGFPINMNWLHESWNILVVWEAYFHTEHTVSDNVIIACANIWFLKFLNILIMSAYINRPVTGLISWYDSTFYLKARKKSD